MSAATDGPKLQVLICHAKADAGFAAELSEGLAFDNRSKSIVSDPALSDGEDSKRQRGDAIAAADVVVFVLSPAAAGSAIFDWEVDCAFRMSKMVVPAQLAPIENMPAPLAALTPVRFDGEHSFMEGLKTLIGRLPSDIGWLQYHTALSMRAHQWNESGRPQTHLLTAEETKGAKNWTAARPEHAPKPSDLQLEFIAECEAVGKPELAAVSNDAAAQQAAGAENAAPAEETSTLKKANKAYAIFALLLAIVAGLAAWQAWSMQKRVAATDEKIKAHEQAAELSKVTLAIQKERIQDAIKTVNSNLCPQAEKVTNLLATTSDPNVWDTNYDMFWFLYEGPMIALEQLYGTLSETERSPVADAMIAFSNKVGTRGEPYEARVAGLPKPGLLDLAASLTATCKKVNGTEQG